MLDCDRLKPVWMEVISNDRFEKTPVEANVKRIRTSLNIMSAIVTVLPFKNKANIGRLEVIEAILYQMSLVMIMRFDKDRKNRVDTIPITDEDTVVEANLKRLATSLNKILAIVGNLLEA